ncbi:MAG: hypothetical protein AAB969_02010 [Patescibacteria group bacterium]
MPTYHLDVYCKKEGRTIHVGRQITDNFKNNKEAIKRLKAAAQELQLSQDYTRVYCKIKKDKDQEKPKVIKQFIIRKKRSKQYHFF